MLYGGLGGRMFVLINRLFNQNLLKMGIQKWGAFGGFQNKTGPLVGHWVNGQNVITAIPHPSQEPASTGQEGQRSKFGMTISWLRILKAIIRAGFKIHKAKESGWSAAVGYNLEHAITGVAPDFTIDYEKVQFTKGDLAVPFSAGVSAAVAAALTFTWTDFVNPGSGAATDKATLVVFCPSLWLFVTVVGGSGPFGHDL